MPRSLLRAQTGWLVQASDYRLLNKPPRPRLQRNGTIFLAAQHFLMLLPIGLALRALLGQGGEFSPRCVFVFSCFSSSPPLRHHLLMCSVPPASLTAILPTRAGSSSSMATRSPAPVLLPR